MFGFLKCPAAVKRRGIFYKAEVTDITCYTIVSDNNVFRNAVLLRDPSATCGGNHTLKGAAPSRCESPSRGAFNVKNVNLIFLKASHCHCRGGVARSAGGVACGWSMLAPIKCRLPRGRTGYRRNICTSCRAQAVLRGFPAPRCGPLQEQESDRPVVLLINDVLPRLPSV
jgi:hypothetical protein